MNCHGALAPRRVSGMSRIALGAAAHVTPPLYMCSFLKLVWEKKYKLSQLIKPGTPFLSPHLYTISRQLLLAAAAALIARRHAPLCTCGHAPSLHALSMSPAFYKEATRNKMFHTDPHQGDPHRPAPEAEPNPRLLQVRKRLVWRSTRMWSSRGSQLVFKLNTFVQCSLSLAAQGLMSSFINWGFVHSLFYSRERWATFCFAWIIMSRFSTCIRVENYTYKLQFGTLFVIFPNLTTIDFVFFK